MSKMSYHRVLIRVELPHHAHAYVRAKTEEEAFERVEDFIHKGDEQKEYLYDIDQKKRLFTIEQPEHISWRRTNTIADFDGADIQILHTESF